MGQSKGVALIVPSENPTPAGCGRHIDWTISGYCGRDGVLCVSCANIDSRWLSALDGLRCLAMVAREDDRQQRMRAAASNWVHRRQTWLSPLPYLAEITGVAGRDVWVVLDDETEPRKVSWHNIIPLAPQT